MPETIIRQLEEIRENGILKEKEHIGIFNIQQRLLLLYGKEYGLTVEHVKPSGTAVTICIPKTKGEKDMKVVIIDDEPLISDKLKGSWKRDYGVCIRFVLLQMHRWHWIILNRKTWGYFDRYSYAGHHWNRSGKADQSNGLWSKIVFLTGYAEFEYARYGIEYKVFDYL